MSHRDLPLLPSWESCAVSCPVLGPWFLVLLSTPRHEEHPRPAPLPHRQGILLLACWVVCIHTVRSDLRSEFPRTLGSVERYRLPQHSFNGAH